MENNEPNQFLIQKTNRKSKIFKKVSSQLWWSPAAGTLHKNVIGKNLSLQVILIVVVSKQENSPTFLIISCLLFSA